MKRITGLLIFVLMGETIAMGSMSMLEKLMFSNKGYQKNIKVEAYLISEDEICHLLEDANIAEPKQITYKELNRLTVYDRKTIYLVVRLKNEGDRGASGTLNCKVYGRSIDVHIPSPLPFQKWSYYIISLAGAGWSMDDAFPEIKTEWEELYVK